MDPRDFTKRLREQAAAAYQRSQSLYPLNPDALLDPRSPLPNPAAFEQSIAEITRLNELIRCSTSFSRLFDAQQGLKRTFAETFPNVPLDSEMNLPTAKRQKLDEDSLGQGLYAPDTPPLQTYNRSYQAQGPIDLLHDLNPPHYTIPSAATSAPTSNGFVPGVIPGLNYGHETQATILSSGSVQHHQPPPPQQQFQQQQVHQSLAPSQVVPQQQQQAAPPPSPQQRQQAPPQAPLPSVAPSLYSFARPYFIELLGADKEFVIKWVDDNQHEIPPLLNIRNPSTMAKQISPQARARAKEVFKILQGAWSDEQKLAVKLYSSLSLTTPSEILEKQVTMARCL